MLPKWGEIDRDGYRRLIMNGQRIRAHRFVWLLFFGEIPEGMVIRHKCDNPPCINPDHLDVGTPADNFKDMIDRERICRGERKRNAKLSEAQVRSILSQLQEDGSLTRIGKQFGVSKHVINDIKRGKTWKHIPR